jgi:hypothetical protein
MNRVTRVAIGAIATAGVALLSTLASAQPGASTVNVSVSATPDVAPHREAPFDQWRPSGPARLKPPTQVTGTSAEGFLEVRLKRALVDALQDEAHSVLGPAYNEALANLVEGLAASVSGDVDRLTVLGGLGSTVMRTAITYYLDGLVPSDPACGAPQRFDALYEGLGISVAFAPIDSPRKRGGVPATCEATARQAARALDGAVLRTRLPDDVRRNLTTIQQAVEQARKSCAEVPGAAQGALDPLKGTATEPHVVTVGEAMLLLRTLRTTPATPPPPLPATSTTPDASAPPSTAPAASDQACAAAIDALRAPGLEPLEALAKEGLANAPLDAVVGLLDVPQGTTTSLLARLGTGAGTVDDLREIVRALVKAAGLPAGTPVLAQALEVLPDAVTGEFGSPTIDPRPVIAALMQKYDLGEDGKPSLRALLGLQPTPWVFELNGGLPNVDFTQDKVVADVSVGYASATLGLVGRGWIDTYDLNTSQTHSDYTHTGGSLEGWWLSGNAQSPLRLELRFSGEFDYYDTTTYPLQDSLSQFYDFDSRMGRGTLFVGLRYGSPVDRISAQLLLGGGGQYEDPDTTRFTSGNTFSLNSDDNFSAQASGRLLVRAHIVPQLLGARLKLESTYFNITREELSAVSTMGQLSTTSTVNQDQQLEFHGRLFLDADVASFAGFVPAVFAGLDYLGIQGNTTTISQAIPLVGIGFVRQSW